MDTSGPSAEVARRKRTPCESIDSAARARLIRLLTAMRPERSAGGFPRDDGTIEFYTRVNALLNHNMTLLNYGAGRGAPFDVPDPGLHQALQQFQNRVAKVIGVDIDEGIHDHPYLDERHVIRANEQLPIPSGTIDIVIADWVVEHLESPAQWVGEMERVLVRSGWLCARTVNRWGYVGFGARLLPNWLHARLVSKLIPVARSVDVFPTVYRLNSLADLKRWFSTDLWENCSYLVNSTPRYFGDSRLLFRAIELYQKIVPYHFRTDLFMFMRRR